MFRRENNRSKEKTQQKIRSVLLAEIYGYSLARRPIPIVVMVVPVVFGTPATLVFIPPAVIALPAIFASFVKVAARMICLTAIAAVMLNGLVQAMIGFRDTPLAIVGIGAQTRCAGKNQKPGERRTRQHYFPQPKYFGLKFRPHLVLLYLEMRLKQG